MAVVCSECVHLSLAKYTDGSCKILCAKRSTGGCPEEPTSALTLLDLIVKKNSWLPMRTYMELAGEKYRR